MQDRDSKGRFPVGQSGNPGGKAKGLERRVRDLIGDDIDKMTLSLRDIVLDPSAPRRDRIEAYKVLADRGWGKARQTVDVSADLTVGQRIERSLTPLTDEQLLLLAEIDAVEDGADGDSGSAPD
jgi:hypothetical protein